MKFLITTFLFALSSMAFGNEGQSCYDHRPPVMSVSSCQYHESSPGHREYKVEIEFLDVTNSRIYKTNIRLSSLERCELQRDILAEKLHGKELIEPTLIATCSFTGYLNRMVLRPDLFKIVDVDTNYNLNWDACISKASEINQ